MRISTVLNEMAWMDKFSKFEQHVHDTNMTMEELIDYLRSEWNIILMPQPSMQTGPMEAGGASFISAEKAAQIGLPDEYKGASILEIQIGPGITGETPVSEVPMILDRLRHELSHYHQQARPEEHWPQYVQPGGDPFEPQSGAYTVQPQERPVQALDVANGLAVLQLRPEDFEREVDRLTKKFSELSKEGGMSAEDVHNEARTLTKHLLGLDPNDEQTKKMILDWQLNTVLGIINAKITQMAVHRTLAKNVKVPSRNQMRKLRTEFSELEARRDELSAHERERRSEIEEQIKDMEQKRRVLNRYHQFMKAIKNAFPKAKGYYKKLEPKRIEALNRTLPQRQEIRKQVEMVIDELIAKQRQEGKR